MRRRVDGGELIFGHFHSVTPTKTQFRGPIHFSEKGEIRNLSLRLIAIHLRRAQRDTHPQRRRFADSLYSAPLKTNEVEIFYRFQKYTV